MSDTKINLVVVIPGATMMSEQECSKQLKKPVINKKGKYAGKQARDKKGNLLWYYESVPDLSKYDKHEIRVITSEEGEKKSETITYHTRKYRSVRQVINLTKDAYDYFISNEAPYGYRAPKDFKPSAKAKKKKQSDNLSNNALAWRDSSIKERLEWHLNSICASMGGKMESYKVFND